MCVFVLRATFSKKCVWLICNEYGGLQQIKTVIKIVCKPTISINLKIKLERWTACPGICQMHE